MTFATEAPKYWDAGHNVVPADGKRPIVKAWTGYQDNPATDGEKTDWVENNRDGNVFLLLGAAVDEQTSLFSIDVDDDRLAEVTRTIIGDPLISKRGARGESIFVRAPNADKIKSTKIDGAGSLGNIDILGPGKGTIVPPSMHPNTGEPYHWLGRSLLDVELTDLPIFDNRKFKILKAVIGSDHTPHILSGESTHEPTLSLVGLLVSIGVSDDDIRSIIRSLLPVDYQGDTMNELGAMIAGAREKGFDDDDKEEGKQSEIALSLLGDGLHLFKTDLGEAFAEIVLPEGARISDKVNSPTVTEYVEYCFFKSQGKPISPQGLSEVKSTLIARAKYEGPTEPVFVRKAYYHGCIFIDLGRSDGQTVRINANGWDIITNPPVRFRRPLGFGELPLPTRGSTKTAMYDLFGLKGPNAVLRLAFELTALSPDGPYFALMTQGSQG
jgi:hypothetical protein